MKVLHRRDASFKVLHWPKLFEGRISLADNYDNNYADGKGAGLNYGSYNGDGWAAQGYGDGEDYGTGYGNGYGYGDGYGYGTGYGNGGSK